MQPITATRSSHSTSAFSRTGRLASLARTACAALACSALALLLGACSFDGDDASGSEPVITSSPQLQPGFDFRQHDYAVRCNDGPVAVTVNAPAGWRVKIGQRKARTGSFTITQPLKANRSFRFAVTTAANTSREFHVRCLPDNFPPYRLKRYRPGGPRLTMVEMGRYAVAFDRAGVPVWWFYASGDVNNAQFMGDGTFSYAPVNGFYSRDFMIHRLDGKHIRTMQAAGGLLTDVHDLIRLPNGNYMLGAHRNVKGVDTRSVGGPPSATLDTAQVQELTPSGRLVWKWNAWPRIGLKQTGRWWKQLLQNGPPFDVNHWNSVDRRGNRVLLSFRHLDAVLLINRASGRIIWKLGGRRIPQSLALRKDPRARYPLGGQHHARFQPDGSITILDNATGLKNDQPRAVHYRINRAEGTATLLRQVTDPEVKASVGFASANRFPDGSWMVGWGAIGQRGIIGGYTKDGQPAFRLITPKNVSYRANPVKANSPTVGQLRRAMDRMAAREN